MPAAVVRYMTALALSQKRTLAAVALCGLLVGLAGCSGLSPLGDGGPADDETTDGPDVTAELTDLPETHPETVRSAGSVTITRTVTVSTANSNLNQETTWRIDFESGRAYKSMQPLGGTDSEKFRTANGTVYERLGTGSRQFVRPDRTTPIDTEQALQVSGALESVVDASERTGTRTTDGVEATVYVADDLDAFPEGYRENLTTATIENYRSVLVVAPSGYVVNSTVATTISRDDRTQRIRQTIRFTGLGQTTVEDPGWLADASAFARQPGPGDVVSRTYNATGEGGLVQLNVSAEKQELDPPSTVGPQLSENPIFRNDLLNSVRVGSIARYYFLLDTVERVEIRIHYDQRQIAPENESELRVAVRNDTNGFWDLLNTTVDEEANVVTATITDPENLEKYQGKTMLAMHFEEFVERLRDRSRR
jgi:hypothetical protein